MSSAASMQSGHPKSAISFVGAVDRILVFKIAYASLRSEHRRVALVENQECVNNMVLVAPRFTLLCVDLLAIRHLQGYGRV